MCCIRGICILAPGANVSANMIFHPVQVATSLQVTIGNKPDFERLKCCNLMKLTNLLKLVDKMQQAGKIDNLQQVYGVFGCGVVDVEKLSIGSSDR